MFSKITVFLIVILLSSCASIPEVLQGEYSVLTPTQAKESHQVNEKVRWSGIIIQTINRKNKTCFEVVESVTDKTLKPVKILPKNNSRFIACKNGFMEPLAFNKRMVTITGKISGYTKQKVGDFDYEYPVIETDIIYIWRKSAYNTYYPRNFAYITNFSCLSITHHPFCY